MTECRISQISLQCYYVIMKQCTKCGQLKPLSEFTRHKITKDGLNHKCKSCTRDLNSQRAKSDPRSSLRATLWKRLRHRPTDDPVTVDELLVIWSAQQGKCVLTGMNMVWGGDGGGDGSNSARPNSVSIDRIDCSKGYERDNVRLVCHCVNSFRGSMSDTEMLVYARLLVERHASS